MTERYDRLDDALAMGPRILIGGNGLKRTLRTAARFGHEWNSIVLTPEDYKTSVAILERHCAEVSRGTDVGRDPAEIHKSTLLFAITGPDRAPEDLVTRRFIDMMAPGQNLTVDDIRSNRTAHPAFVRTQEELIDRLGRLGEAALQEVVFEHFCTESDDVPEWLAAQIVPAVENF